MAQRARAIVSNQSRPRLKRHVRLQFDPIRSAWALLAPEKILWPDETSLSIINLCDGNRQVDEIVATLAEDYAAPLADVNEDVLDFLQVWSDRALVSL